MTRTRAGVLLMLALTVAAVALIPKLATMRSTIVTSLPTPGATQVTETPSGTPDLTDEVVAVDHLPPLGSGDTSVAGLLGPEIRTWAAARADVYAGQILANGHIYVGFTQDAAIYLAALRAVVSRPTLVRAS